MANKKLFALVILDGFGISNFQNGNAPLLADMQNVKNIHHAYPWALLDASGQSVGLPDDAYGTCQNGHMTIGTGRVNKSFARAIKEDILSKQFNKREVLIQAIKIAKERNKEYVHIISPVTKSPIIGYEADLFALIQFVHAKGLKPIVHAITDGYDVKKKSAEYFLNDLDTILKQNDGELADISGRFYALDNNKNWKRSIRAWNMMASHDADGFKDFQSFILEQYDNSINDEFFIPTFNVNCENGKLEDDDVVIFTPYRYGGQFLQLLTGLYKDEENIYNVAKKSNLYVVTLTPYDESFNLPHVYPPLQLKNTLTEVLDNNNIKLFRIAESLRDSVLSFYFDGNRNIELQHETKEVIPSANVLTYDLKPQLSAVEITNAIVRNLEENQFFIINFANPDILGHTGNLDAAVKACKIIDYCLGTLHEEIVTKRDGCLAICSDHGNCEQMIDEENANKTYHTTNKVPFIFCDRNVRLNDVNATLADVAPTILDYLDIKIPEEMTGKSLIKQPTWWNNFSDHFKKRKMPIEIMQLNEEELNRILSVDNSYNKNNIKYEDENDFSMLDV